MKTPPPIDLDDYLTPEEWEARAKAEPNGSGRPTSSLLIWYGDEPPPPPAYLVRNMLPETGVAIIGGQTTLGKTFIGSDLAAAVMTGGDFAGEPVMRRGRRPMVRGRGRKGD